MKFSDIEDVEDRVVFEGSDFVIIRVYDLLPRHRNYPWGAYDVIKPNGRPAIRGRYRDRDRSVVKLYIHQTAGSITYEGLEAVFATANFFVRDPAWDDQGRWTGRGRGWPFFGYTWYLPWLPDRFMNKMVIYQTNPRCRVSWHSSDNEDSVALVCQGYFKSRHMKRFRPKKGQTGSPSDDQMRAIRSFTIEYAMSNMGIGTSCFLGHMDSPKPKKTCPGDDLENFYRGVVQGNDTELIPDRMTDISLPGMLELDEWEERQAALVLLGHDIGHYGRKSNGVDGDPGELTRLAIEAQESMLGLPVDGYWDDTFDHIVKLTLMAQCKTSKDIAELI